MSLIPLAAALIRQAAVDERYAIDLEIAVEDRRARRGLVDDSVDEQELSSLRPSEWLWFTAWRQQHGGRLDPVVLDWLSSAAFSRVFRFELRGVVLRDARTIRELELEPLQSAGLRWLLQQIELSDPIELARDALQHGTPASWWLIERLLEDDRWGLRVTDFVRTFVASRSDDPDSPLR